MSNASAPPSTTSPESVRLPSVLDLSTPQSAGTDGARRWTGRGQNFAVAWVQAGTDAAASAIDSAWESMLIVLDAPIEITGAGQAVTAPPRSICIVPPGAWQLRLHAGATGATLSSLPAGAQAGALNEDAYATPDARIVPVGDTYRHVGDGSAIRVIPIDTVMASKDKPRLKMLQTATLSINWVEYVGPRDRRALSPHSHVAFEQGSLALSGDFVHHLRVKWGPDADEWRDDTHARVGSPSLLVVPVRTIHTTEGVGEGHHLLIDVFSPPRADFIGNGWVANAGDYRATEPAQEPAVAQ